MIGEGIAGLRADALAVDGQQVYLAGRWATNYDRSVLFRWDGSRWNQIGSFSKQDGFVSSMVVMGRNLYVGGKFDSMAGVPVNNIAQWDGSRWRSLGTGLPGCSEWFQFGLEHGGFGREIVCGWKFWDGGWEGVGEFCDLDGRAVISIFDF